MSGDGPPIAGDEASSNEGDHPRRAGFRSGLAQDPHLTPMQRAAYMKAKYLALTGRSLRLNVCGSQLIALTMNAQS